MAPHPSSTNRTGELVSTNYDYAMTFEEIGAALGITPGAKRLNLMVEAGDPQIALAKPASVNSL
jgi:hypothetical protein